METEYAGTYSAVPQHKTDLSIMRVQRGKRSKGNRVQPREHGPYSACISHKPDGQGGYKSTLFTPSHAERTERKQSTRLSVDMQNALDEAGKRSPLRAQDYGNNSDAD